MVGPRGGEVLGGHTDIDPPTVAIDASPLFDLKSNQRATLIRYLRRLTPGVRIRIIGSQLVQRKLIRVHGDLLPVSVTERARSRHQADRERADCGDDSGTGREDDDPRGTVVVVRLPLVGEE